MKNKFKWKVIVCLVFVSLFGMCTFYWSYAVNLFNCPHDEYISGKTKNRKSGICDYFRVDSKSDIHDVNKRKEKENFYQKKIRFSTKAKNITYLSNRKLSFKTIHTYKKQPRIENETHMRDLILVKDVLLNRSIHSHSRYIKQKNVSYNHLNVSRQKDTSISENKKRKSKHSLNVPGQTSYIKNHLYLEDYTPKHQVNTTSETTLVKEDTISKDVIQSGIYIFHNISCKALRPDALLYNRIFKTASSSISEYMKELSARLNYYVDLSTTEDWYKTGNPYPYPNIIEQHVKRRTSRIAFVAHFYFRHNLNIATPYTYINIVREPIQRIISHYRYMRTENRPKHRIIEMKRAGLWNESLVNCIKHEHRGCESNVMTRFFCGTKPFCKTGPKKALKLAKVNIKRYYAAIGLQENISLFLEILKKRLPGYFSSGNITIPQIKRNTKRNDLNDIPIKVIGMIRERNFADIKLYKFLTTRFWVQIKKCSKII